MFGREEKVIIDTHEKCMAAARRVACVLAMYDLPGFRNVLHYLEENQTQPLRNWRKKHDYEVCDRDPRLLYRVRDAFTLIADTGIIPTTARKGASRCGGVRPGKDGDGPLNPGSPLVHPLGTPYGSPPLSAPGPS